MVRESLISSKLADLHDRLERVRSRAKSSPEALANDRDALELVSFNLMLAVQCCADIAAHLIADEGWPVATTLASSFDRLRMEGVLSAEVAASLARAVGLRNIVAHGYAGVDVRAVHAASVAGVADLERFATEVAGWVQRRAKLPGS